MSAFIAMLVRNGMMALGTMIMGTSWGAGNITMDDWSSLIEPTVGFVLAVVSILWKVWVNRSRRITNPPVALPTGLPGVVK